MSFKERQETFKAAIRAYDFTESTKYSESFGVSNSAKIVEGGLYVCNVNLSNVPARHDQLILANLIRFPPEDEVYFAVYIRDGLTPLRSRLNFMTERGKELATKYGKKAAAAEEPSEEISDDEQTSQKDDVIGPETDKADLRMYSSSNNNTKCYIAPGGMIYLRNKGFWDSLKFDFKDIQPGVQVEKIVFSIWPPAVSARRSVIAQEFVGYLGDLIGRERIHEISVWPDASALSPEMRRMPNTLDVADIEIAMQKLGGFYPGGEVRRYHVALNFLRRKHFVILSGLSGTGKTQLALHYARAVHGLSSDEAKDPLLFLCPVRPEWTDPTGLTGYYDVLSNRYVVPRFLEAVLVATAHRDSPVFVVLDEMNLARVEYYFSDVLSCIETRDGEIHLHSSGVPIEGSTGTGGIPAALPWPPNLYIAGTINVDETTNPVSDKVLDRAIVIDMSEIVLSGFLSDLESRHPELKAARAAAEPVLVAVHALMQEHRLGFGYRLAEEVVRYHAFATLSLGATSTDIMDQLMVQKVLVKLRGADRQGSLLTGLQKALADMPKSQDLLTRLTADLHEFGSFQTMR